MRYLMLAVLAIFLSATPLQAQDANLWKTLSKIAWEKKYDELLGFKVDMPVFSKDVEALEGEIVEVSGYIVPVEGYKGHTEFILSAYPYNMCFFCGGAGPETVMEVTASKPVGYTTERIRLRGRLQLNGDDINRLLYILVDAEMIRG